MTELLPAMNSFLHIIAVPELNGDGIAYYSDELDLNSVILPLFEPCRTAHDAFSTAPQITLHADVS